MPIKYRVHNWWWRLGGDGRHCRPQPSCRNGWVTISGWIPSLFSRRLSSAKSREQSMEIIPTQMPSTGRAQGRGCGGNVLSLASPTGSGHSWASEMSDWVYLTLDSYKVDVCKWDGHLEFWQAMFHFQIEKNIYFSLPATKEGCGSVLGGYIWSTNSSSARRKRVDKLFA